MKIVILDTEEIRSTIWLKTDSSNTLILLNYFQSMYFLFVWLSWMLIDGAEMLFKNSKVSQCFQHCIATVY